MELFNLHDHALTFIKIYCRFRSQRMSSFKGGRG